MVFAYIIENIMNIHYKLMEKPKLTKSKFDKLRKKSIFSGTNEFKSINEVYQDLFYFIRNTFLFIFGNKLINNINQKYLENTVKENKIEDIELKLRITSRSLEEIDNVLLSNEYMNEIVTKTNKVFEEKTEKNLDEYSSLMKYISGNCWINDKLSLGFELDDNDIKMRDNIHSILDRVEPLSFPVTLFHGFESFTHYGENNWKIGDIINIPGFLSKSLSFNVAHRFAQTENFMNCKFLVVKYPKNTKHISLNIRYFDQEFEFLTYSNEKLKLVDIKQVLNYPQNYTLYICELI